MSAELQTTTRQSSNSQFEGFVSVDGKPVAVMTELGRTFRINRESLVMRIKNMLRDGRDVTFEAAVLAELNRMNRTE